MKQQWSRILVSIGLVLCGLTAATIGFAQPKITPAKDIIGFTLGDDYKMANYTQLATLMQKWASESDRIKLVSIGNTEEGRTEYMAIISSPANLAKLDHWKDISQKMARGRITPEQAEALAEEGKAVVFLSGGLHASESVNQHAIGEMIYQMASRTDKETMRFLNDVVTLLCIVNPDGDELVANWYMRNPDSLQRSMNNLPKLYNKYVGHDNNRDFLMFNMKETENWARQNCVEWIPQILYDAHQTGPAGAVVFVPPFREPFNYFVDPMVPVGVEQLGDAMMARLIAKNMGGGATREAASYSSWWNGGIRTTPYWRNQIGLMSEIIGGPTPQEVPVNAVFQLPHNDWPLAVEPTQPTTTWHYRQSVDYMIELYRAVVDYASLNRQGLLSNMYMMARRNIQKGNEDSWTVTPAKIAAMEAAAAKAPAPANAGGRGGRGGAPAAGGDSVSVGFGGASSIPIEFYNNVLHAPDARDPRGYVISTDQDDYPTAVKFINVLIKGGAEVQRATADFAVAGKTYPKGSFVVKSAQAFRPLVLDTFEPNFHPTDLAYPGGPPKRPYDITGWTIAKQMGVKFDRILDGFNGPFVDIGFDVLPPPVASIGGVAKPAGYLVSHKENDSFVLINRLLKAKADVYWLKDEVTVNGKGLGTGTIYVPASAAAQPVLEQGAKGLGVTIVGVAAAPKGDAVKLKPIRIGLVDLYGGSMASGWLRWMFEHYEFPHELVFPQVLEAGNLKASYDVVVFPSGVYTEGRGGRGGGGGGRGGPAPEAIPEEMRSMLGSITNAKTVPAVRKFVEDGGTIVALGSAASIGGAMGLPVEDYLTENGAPLPATKFFIPGSVLSVKFNNKNPIAYGMPDEGYIFFDSSPVFRLKADATPKLSRVSWFDTKTPLFSGWAIGQQYLDGGDLATEASIGAGKIVIIGFEATFRGTPHATFKLFFNSLYYGSATPAALDKLPPAGTN